jgi:K319-like protein
VKHLLNFLALLVLLSASSSRAERINQEGRILGPVPVVTNAILFNTNYADAIVSNMQIFPVTNPWNEDISRRPLLTNSDAMISEINSNVGASHRGLELFQEMNFVLVPDTQSLVSNKFVVYAGDSDFNGGIYPYGLYPTPTNMPIEEWPTGTGTQTLLQWQTNNTTGADRHSIIVQPGTGFIYETWKALRIGTNWQAANGAIFNLNSNALRPDGYTSGDAAGFPMFPALVRYDECQRGMVEHACRLVVVKSRSQHIYPATHDAGSVAGTELDYPAMGQRLRLKASFVIQTNWTREEKALLLGLKKYGAMVSDNSSSFFSISITPDDRWGNAFTHIANAQIGITNFEVIQSTGPNEGPRSPGAPTADAGSDQTVSLGAAVQLHGVVNSTGSPLVISWKLYSGPGTVTFGDAAQTNTTATFSAPGTYILMLSADDGVHAIAYDAVIVTVINGIALSISMSNTNANLTWVGGSPPYILQQSDTSPGSSWEGVVTTSQTSVSVPLSPSNRFFRVEGTSP